MGSCTCPNCDEQIETEETDNNYWLEGECECGTKVGGNDMSGYEEV